MKHLMRLQYFGNPPRLFGPLFGLARGLITKPIPQNQQHLAKHFADLALGSRIRKSTSFQ
eukprot:5865179-Heterocapsa_arctica.AAC.1